MAFADRLDRNDLTMVTAVIIGGIPYIFSTSPQPDGFSAVYDGETYTWLDSLEKSSVGRSSSRVDTASGIAVGGGRELRFELRGTQRAIDAADADGIWHELLIRQAYREDKQWTYLVRSLSYAMTSTAYVSDPAWSGTKRGYLGLETIKWVDQTAGSGSTPGTFSTLTRGAYGSEQSKHDIPLGGTLQVGGMPRITSWPRAWRGRRVLIFEIPGRYRGGSAVDGTDTPWATSLGSSDVGVRGYLVHDLRLSTDGQSAVLELVSLEQLLARDICTRLPHGPIGPSWRRDDIGTYDLYAQMPMVQIDERTSRLEWAFEGYWGAGVDVYSNRVDRIERVDDTGSPVVLEDVPYGTYYLHEVSRYFADTLIYGEKPALGGAAVEVPNSFRSARIYSEGVGKKQRIYLEVAFDDDFGTTSLHFETYGFLEALGFERGTLYCEREVVSGATYYRAKTERGLPHFFWPAYDGSDRELYLLARYGQENPDYDPQFDGTPGIETDAGVAVDGYARVAGSEIVSFSGTTGADAAPKTITITGREQMGSVLDEDFFVAADLERTKIPLLEQGPAFPGCSELRIALYLLLGGTSDADYGEPAWAGAAINPDWVDVDGIEALHGSRPDPTDNWMILKKTKLRDVLSRFAQRGQFFWVEKDGQLSVVDFSPPLAHEVASYTLLDEDYLDCSKTKVVSAEDEIVNVVEARLAYDNASEKYGTEAVASDAQSVVEWGAREGRSLELRGFAGWEKSTERLASVLSEFFSAQSDLKMIFDLHIARATGLALRLGDRVRITHPTLPGLSEPVRGISEIPGQIVELEQEPYPENGVFARATVVTRAATGMVGRALAPALWLESGSGVNWVASASRFSASAADEDWTWHEAGYIYRVFEPGRESAAYVGVGIVSINPATGAIVVDTNLAGLTAPIVMDFEASDQGVADAQLLFAYGSDGSGALDLPASAATEAHRYL